MARVHKVSLTLILAAGNFQEFSELKIKTDGVMMTKMVINDVYRRKGKVIRGICM